jgi:D-alanyl-D-alanine carboxypeptidase
VPAANYARNTLRIDRYIDITYQRCYGLSVGSEPPGSSSWRSLVTLTLVGAVLAAVSAACRGNETRGEPSSREASDLIDWIAAHPEQVSLLASGGGDGARELAWQAERSRPVGSTFKLLVLAAYAREVAAGRLDPAERIARAELDRWYVEGTDGGAHERALAAMPADTGRRLALDQLVRAMIEFSDNAATDFLLTHIGRARVLETAALLDVEALGAGVSPIVGALLSTADDGLGNSVDERIRRLRALPVGERAEHAWRLAAAYAEAPEAALAGLAPTLASLGDWGKQVALADALPWRGSARDLAALVGEARNGKAFGREAAGIMERQLSWPMAEPRIAARFEALGLKEGATAGVRALAGFARPRNGPWSGRERVVVLLFEGMDAATWQASEEAVSQLAADLADTPEVVASLRERMNR